VRDGLHKPELVLIDVDGTLVDSVPDLLLAVNETMQAIGRPVWPETKVREWIGNGVERLCRRALIGQLDGEPDEATFERAYPIFLERYDQHNGKHSRLYPGILDGLAELEAKGYPLGCVTNKAARYTLPLLEALGVKDRFGMLLCGDQLPRKKPDPMPLLHAAEQFSATPQNCLMIGDSISDVKAARAAGFAIICMSYGYNHGVDIREAAPDAVVDSLVEAAALLD
jgi:phosphoglycolate phosphatase